MLSEARLVWYLRAYEGKIRDTVSSPGHLGFSHPQEVHVAGQDREVGIWSCLQASPRVSIAKEDIQNQL